MGDGFIGAALCGEAFADEELGVVEEWGVGVGSDDFAEGSFGFFFVAEVSLIDGADVECGGAVAGLGECFQEVADGVEGFVEAAEAVEGLGAVDLGAFDLGALGEVFGEGVEGGERFVELALLEEEGAEEGEGFVSPGELFVGGGGGEVGDGGGWVVEVELAEGAVVAGLGEARVFGVGLEEFGEFLAGEVVLGAGEEAFGTEEFFGGGVDGGLGVEGAGEGEGEEGEVDGNFGTHGLTFSGGGGFEAALPWIMVGVSWWGLQPVMGWFV